MSWFRRTPLAQVRWVVLDCETSGLDPARDRLLSVGAVRVALGRIDLSAPFCAVLRQQAPSDEANILVHRIGADAQLAGRDPETVLRALDAYLEGAYPVAFHAAFDAAVLRRAMAKVRGLHAPRRWLDLARLAPALFPSLGRGLHALDDWLQAFGIEAADRHDALADAYATAQLHLVLLAEAERQGLRTQEDLASVAGDARWLASS